MKRFEALPSIKKYIESKRFKKQPIFGPIAKIGGEMSYWMFKTTGTYKLDIFEVVNWDCNWVLILYMEIIYIKSCMILQQSIYDLQWIIRNSSKNLNWSACRFYTKVGAVFTFNWSKVEGRILETQRYIIEYPTQIWDKIKYKWIKS